MEKGRNDNNPKKGSSIKVDPITELKDIGLIKKILADKPRDLCLFTIGINTNLRASDFLRITAGQVRNLSPGDDLVIKEKEKGSSSSTGFIKTSVDKASAFDKVNGWTR